MKIKSIHQVNSDDTAMSFMLTMTCVIGKSLADISPTVCVGMTLSYYYWEKRRTSNDYVACVEYAREQIVAALNEKLKEHESK